MIGKIITWMGLILLTACAVKEDPFMQPMFGDVPAAYSSVQSASSKIAVLLPLSGKAKNIGADMKKAAMMAEFDKRMQGVAVVFYDTMGTPEGAQKAYEDAMAIKPSVVVGPVFSSETETLKEEGVDVPVISFTSDDAAVGDEVYTLALMIPNQIERIVEHTCQAGRRKIALIGPENRVGEIVLNSLEKAIETCPEMEVVGVSLYNPKTINFDPVIAKIAPQPIDSRKKDLTDEEKELLAKPITEKVNFDTLLVFEDGVKLQQVMSMLTYYDVTPDQIPTYGLASWGNVKMNELVGGYYPAMPSKWYTDFAGRFKRNFDTKPSPLAAYAYDAVSLGILLGESKLMTANVLENPQGYDGVNGRFKLNSNGTNTRLLDMIQVVSKNRSVVVDEAPEHMPAREPVGFFGKKTQISQENAN